MSNMSELVRLSRAMQSLVAKLESKEPHTSRDISDLREHIVSQQSRIDISLERISRLLADQQDQIASIAASQVRIENLVIAQQMAKEDLPETPSPKLFGMQLPEADMEAYVNSLIRTPERSCSPDITCYETFGHFNVQFQGQIYHAPGTGDYQEPGSPGELMRSFLMPSLRNQEQNGGMDISEKEKSSLMISDREE